MNDDISKIAGVQRQISWELLQRARELRTAQTSAEVILWECVRDRRLLSAKFRRQHPIGQYIADFYCHAVRLVVEVDGEIHNLQQAEDAARDAWMQQHGLRVLRFTNDEVLNRLEGVLEVIVGCLPSP
jgi:very-short-patch-repair endonuclease